LEGVNGPGKGFPSGLSNFGGQAGFVWKRFPGGFQPHLRKKGLGLKKPGVWASPGFRGVPRRAAALWEGKPHHTGWVHTPGAPNGGQLPGPWDVRLRLGPRGARVKTRPFGWGSPKVSRAAPKIRGGETPFRGSRGFTLGQSPGVYPTISGFVCGFTPFVGTPQGYLGHTPPKGGGEKFSRLLCVGGAHTPGVEGATPIIISGGDPFKKGRAPVCYHRGEKHPTLCVVRG